MIIPGPPSVETPPPAPPVTIEEATAAAAMPAPPADAPGGRVISTDDVEESPDETKAPKREAAPAAARPRVKARAPRIERTFPGAEPKALFDERK
jgi:hypothetical protein